MSNKKKLEVGFQLALMAREFLNSKENIIPFHNNLCLYARGFLVAERERERERERKREKERERKREKERERERV